MRLPALLTLLFVARGVVLLCVIPPFEGWDEYQHVAYIVHLLERGERPVPGRADVPESLLRELARFPAPAAAVEQLSVVGVVGYDAFWRHGSPPTYRRPQGPIPLYQAQHTSLYYRLVAPVFAAAGGVSNLGASVAAARAVNLLLAAIAVWIALRGLMRLSPNPRLAALAGLLFVLNPLFGVNAARVSNDALAILFATLAIVWILGFDPSSVLSGRRSRANGASREPSLSEIGCEGRETSRRSLSDAVRISRSTPALKAALIGLMAGLAIVTKAVHLPLIPFAVIVLVTQCRRAGLTWPRVAALNGLFAAGLLCAAAPTLWFNLRHVGSLTTIRDLRVNEPAGDGQRGLLEAAGEVNWLNASWRLWMHGSLWSGGWSYVPMPGWLRSAHEIVIVAAVAGFAARRWRGAARRRDGGGLPERALAESGVGGIHAGWLVLLLACYHAAMVYHVVLLKSAFGLAMTNFWYAAVTLPWMALLLCKGASGWPATWMRAAVVCAWGTVYVAGFGVGVFGRMVATYSDAPLGLEALRRLAKLQPAILGSTTLLVAGGAFVVVLACAIRGARSVTDIRAAQRGQAGSACPELK